MKNGELVPAEVTVNLLKKAIDSNSNTHGFLIDGFPRKLDQAHIFDQTVCFFNFQKIPRKFQKILVIHF